MQIKYKKIGKDDTMEKELIKPKKNYLKTLFILLSIAFASQTIAYLLRGRTILNLKPNFTFFYVGATRNISIDKILGTIIFVAIFGGLAITYFLILKQHKKIFKTRQDMFKFILIVAVIFFIMLPLTSTDVFYYMGTGWNEAHYGINPYYTSVEDVLDTTQVEDAMLIRTPNVWKGTTIVYGPLWPFICKLLSGLSGGNVALGLLIYKLFNLGIHIGNIVLMDKITRGKNVFTLLYALNPLLLFDGLTNVHNDILVIFFILLALYFFIRKKKMLLPVIFLALATAVKYFAILLIPFLVIYYYRKKKPLKRILYACGWAIVFLLVLIGCYMLYMRDFEVLKGVFVQQTKYANSIFLILVLRCGMNTASIISKGCMLAFITFYIMTIIKLLFTKKELHFTALMREYSFILVLFIFGTITNFQSWYCLWLLPTIPWQRGNTINNLLHVTIATELANSVYFFLFEFYGFGQYYFLLMLILILAFSKIKINKVFQVGRGFNEKILKRQ